MMFFKHPKDPASYLTMLRSKQQETQQKLLDQCVTTTDGQFKQLSKQLTQIEKEINRTSRLLVGRCAATGYTPAAISPATTFLSIL